jgi:GNAT superfamily N-acetyltransferase
MTLPVLRAATIDDVPLLLPVVREFYAHFGFPWDEERKSLLLRQFLQTPAAGVLWLAEAEGAVVGYALVPFYFGLEFDGTVALLDELFLRKELRGKGLGGALIAELVRSLRAQGVRRLRLEVDERHPEAASLYRRLGFCPDGRTTWSFEIGG